MTQSFTDGSPEELLEEMLSQHSAESSFHGTSRPESPTPPWKKWSNSLADLLEDPVGNELFREFLEEEKAVEVLLFHLACNGLKQVQPDKRARLINIIYKTFVLKKGALELLPQTQEKLDRAFRESGDSLNFQVFDEAQKEALRVMEKTLHPNFISSEKYQNYVNSQLNAADYEADSSASTTSVDDPSSSATSRQCAHPVQVFQPANMPGICSDSGISINTPQTNTQLPQFPLPVHYPLNKPPPLPPKTSSLSGPRSLTKESLLASAVARHAEDQKKTQEVGQDSGQLNAPYYSKYNAFTMPSARESEVQSHFSDNARQRQLNQNVPAARDILDYSMAEQWAEKNRIEKSNLLLPTTTFQRVQGTVQPKECDARKMPPPQAFAAQLCQKLEKLVCLQDDLVKPLASFSQTSIHSTLSAMDDSERVLDEHLERIAMDKTPDSLASQCASPNPPVRRAFGEHGVGSGYFGQSIKENPMKMGLSSGTGFPENPLVRDSFRGSVEASRPGQISGNSIKEWKSSNATSQPQRSVFPNTSFTSTISPLHQLTNPNRGGLGEDSGLGPSDGGTSSTYAAHPYQNIPSFGSLPVHQNPPLQASNKTLNRITSGRAQRSNNSSRGTSGVPAPGHSEGAGRSSGHRTKSADGRRGKDQLTTVLWKLGQNGEFFMTKLAGKHTLKNFKTVLPPTYCNDQVRFYFKKDLPGTGHVWEQVINDSDILPLHEGRITATIE